MSTATRSKMKKVSINVLKTRAWNLLSKIVRLTACDQNGLAFCVTCWADSDFRVKQFRHYKELQAGHYQDGRGNMILFDERGIYPQCVKCNYFNGGNRAAYVRFLDHELGVEKSKALREDLAYLSKRTYQFSTYELEAKISGYRKRLVALEQKVGV